MTTVTVLPSVRKDKHNVNNTTTLHTASGSWASKMYTVPSTNEQKMYKSSITKEHQPLTLEDMIADMEDMKLLTEEQKIERRSSNIIQRLHQQLIDKNFNANVTNNNSQTTEEMLHCFQSFIKELSKLQFTNDKEWRSKGLRPLLKQRKYKILGMPKKAAMRQMYIHLLSRNEIPQKNENLENFLIRKASRTQSGVMVITVLTSPYPRYGNKFQKFSCKHNCYYCPSEPDMPRSYLSDEPAVQRGWKHNWDAIEQFYARAWTYMMNGHPIDKCELLVLGGTWSEYPYEYQEEFLRDCFWSANTFHSAIALQNNQQSMKSIRLPLSLLEEQKMNETAKCKIIGVTLETRPDSITIEEVQRLRYYGCTRVQIGIQHTNDRILKHINRGCWNSDSMECVQLLKNCGFKIDFHLMPDLPSTDMKTDELMFYEVLNSEYLQADQWKIYPCQITKYTLIEQWFKDGKYVPMSDEQLLLLLMKVKLNIHPWIRLNRVVRDIPNQYIVGGNSVTNLRQFLEQNIKNTFGCQQKCQCIRCREIKGRSITNVILVIRSYISSGGLEFFISFETTDLSIILGFARLRLYFEVNEITNKAFPELMGCAMIRELHVYGQMKPVNRESSEKKQKVQHMGYGKRLMKAAEIVSVLYGFHKISVISGVGTRNYYRKIGYKLRNTYMIKRINKREWYFQKVFYHLKCIEEYEPHSRMKLKLPNAVLSKVAHIPELIVKRYEIQSRFESRGFITAIAVLILSLLFTFWRVGL